MTNPYKQYKTDENLENGDGVEVQFDGFSITIHRAGGANRQFAKVFSAKTAPHRRQIQNNTLSDEVANQLMAETYAETIITSWKNVRDENDKVLPFNKKNCVKLLIDLPELFKELQEHANSVANFKAEEREEEAKNSVKS